jgi:hypothetical protein
METNPRPSPQDDDYRELDYWRWLVRGCGGAPGYASFLDWWLAVHVLVGVGLSKAVGAVTYADIAKNALLPAVSLFVGISFAWTGAAQAVLQTREIHVVGDHHKGGYPHLVYTFQTAILVILCAVVGWGVAAAGAVDSFGPTAKSVSGALLFMLMSLAIRECWSVVKAANGLLLIRKRIVDAAERAEALEKSKVDSEQDGGHGSA